MKFIKNIFNKLFKTDEYYRNYWKNKIDEINENIDLSDLPEGWSYDSETGQFLVEGPPRFIGLSYFIPKVEENLDSSLNTEKSESCLDSNKERIKIHVPINDNVNHEKFFKELKKDYDKILIEDTNINNKHTFTFTHKNKFNENGND